MFAALDLGIDLDVWPWVWLGTAVVFALVELTLVAGTFIILPFAVSAFIAAILAFYDVPIEVQWGVFVFGGAALFAFMYRWAQRFMKVNTMDPGVGADRLVGLTAIVTTPIVPDDTDRKGRVTVDGEVWGAVSDVPRTFEAGSRVRVASMKGTRVVVVPIESPNEATEGEQA
ncbi:MAG: NfeD family protein [Ilumatobacter sp.]|uniref:NfeD family protein n=1 Tax=Ilumatobacter sp. TaxID=1967498 RepID=UPI002603FAA1|nr:NfeD family protein [Ilumatobacter sp.]MDJ0771100.1 NfeD family protein [Ilumatobacter sp.]